MCKNRGEKLSEMLYQKAIGYKAEDVAEEYAMVDGLLVLQKRKSNIKNYPPDLSALQLLLNKMAEDENSIYYGYTLDELLQEKDKLNQLLNENKEEESNEI